MGEVDKIRAIVAPWLKGNGLDLGFGGNPIKSRAICVDLATPYSDYGAPKHLTGDARNLYWFKDGVLDYVFSSHLLEDFTNTEDILIEWLRVLRFGGIIALYLPDEQKYRKVMEQTKGNYNRHHQIEDMSLIYITRIFTHLNIQVIYEYEETDPLLYGFLIVGRK